LNDHDECIRILLATKEFLSKDIHCALARAASAGAIRAMGILIQHGALNRRRGWFAALNHPFLWAAHANQKQAMQTLVSAGMTVDWRHTIHWSNRHHAPFADAFANYFGEHASLAELVALVHWHQSWRETRLDSQRRKRSSNRRVFGPCVRFCVETTDKMQEDLREEVRAEMRANPHKDERVAPCVGLLCLANAKVDLAKVAYSMELHGRRTSRDVVYPLLLSCVAARSKAARANAQPHAQANVPANAKAKAESKAAC
jgi:hypothetical protein